MERAGVLPLYTLSHEPSVGFAADGAARYGGGLGVAAVTYGAGALNMVNALAAAYAEKTPVVVISGAPGESERMTVLAGPADHSRNQRPSPKALPWRCPRKLRRLHIRNMHIKITKDYFLI